MAESKFVSLFKINNVPILPPLIDEKTREEIKLIRQIVRERELKMSQMKKQKDLENSVRHARQLEIQINEVNKSRRLSYTMTSPVFDSEFLPNIDSSSESNKSTVIQETISPCDVDFDENLDATDKSSKDIRNELDKRSLTPASSIYETVIVPQVNIHLKQLIDKQKQEYLMAMEALKDKFSSEQQGLLAKLQNNLKVTSTPLNVSMTIASTDDEDFSAFKTCLQSQSFSFEEETITDDIDAKMKASTIINAYARGFLVRRLMKTVYVQEHIRNIKETLQLVLNLADHHVSNTVQNTQMKSKLFRQLQGDLILFNEIFLKNSTKENMKIISADREMRLKRFLKGEKNSSFILT